MLARLIIRRRTVRLRRVEQLDETVAAVLPPRIAVRAEIETVEDKDGFVTVNDGLEEGGAWLQAWEGGTYRACQMDDHSLYSELGTVELPLSEDLMIVDCGENPEDPSDTLTTGQKLYLETLESWRREFYPLNTRVTVEDGIITAIIRRWIP